MPAQNGQNDFETEQSMNPGSSGSLRYWKQQCLEFASVGVLTDQREEAEQDFGNGGGLGSWLSLCFWV